MNRDQIADHISKHKRIIIGVVGDPELKELSFSYTIGNHLSDLPELLIIGPYPTAISRFLNMACDLMLESKSRLGLGPFEIGGKYPTWVVSCEKIAKVEYTIQATQYFKSEDYDVLQIVLPDYDGRYPWERDCKPAFQIPILGAP